MKHGLFKKNRPFRSRASEQSRVVQRVIGLFVAAIMTASLYLQAQPILINTGNPIIFKTDEYIANAKPGFETFQYLYYQQIILKDEFVNAGGKVGAISALQLNFPDVGNITTYGDWQVWITHITDERFLADNGLGTPDWHNPGTSVFVGNIHDFNVGATNASWFEIPFKDGEFEYNGTDNILVTIYEATPGDQGTWSILSSTSHPSSSFPGSTHRRGQAFVTTNPSSIDLTASQPTAISAKSDTVFQMQFVQPTHIKPWKTGDVIADFDYATYGSAMQDYFFYQQIIRADEYANGGGKAGDIEKMRIYIKDIGTNIDASKEWDIWIGHTPTGKFQRNTDGVCPTIETLDGSVSDWVSLEDMELKFSGDITQSPNVSVKPANNTWMQIDFSTPFAYNGVDNIVIAIHERSAGINTNWSFGGYTGLIGGFNNSLHPGPDKDYLRSRARIWSTNKSIDQTPYEICNYPIDTLNLPPYSFRLDTMLQVQFIGQRVDCNTVQITGDNSVCANGILQLSVTGANANHGTWASGDAAIASVGNGTTNKGKVSGKSGKQGESVIISFTPFGCSTPITHTVTVQAAGTNPPITLSDDAGNTTNLSVCIGATLQLKANPDMGGTWKSLRPDRASASPTGLVTGLDRQAASIAYVVDNGGCTYEKTISVKVENPVIVNLNADKMTVCENETVVLKASGSVVASYTWKGGQFGTTGELKSATETTDPLTADVTYTVEGQTTQGCKGSATIKIKVNNLPAPGVLVVPATFCEGSTGTLEVTGLDSDTKVNWTVMGLGITLIQNGDNKADYTAGNGGDLYGLGYEVENTVTGCKTIGFPVAGTVTANTNVTPEFSSIPNTIGICAGDAVPVLTTSDDNGKPGTWDITSIDNTIAGNGKTYTFTPSGTCVTGTPYVVTVTVTASTAPAFTQIGPLCVGSPAPTLSTTDNNGIAGTWTQNGTTVTTVNTDSPESGINYTFTPTSGCVTTYTMTIVITQLQDPTFATISAELCQNDLAPVLLQTSQNNYGGTWTPSSINTSSPSNGAVTYTWTPNSGQCANAHSIQVAVNPQPSEPGINGATEVCVGDTIHLESSVTAGDWFSTYTDEIDVAGGIVTGKQAGSVTVSYTVTSQGCSNSSTHTVTVKAKPDAGTLSASTNAICKDATVELTPSVATPGVWESSNEGFATVEDGVVTGKGQGTAIISFVVTASNGCKDTTTQNITVSVPVVVSIIGADTVQVDSTSIYVGLPADGTWVPSDEEIATFDPETGELKGLKGGTITLTYTVDNVAPCTGAVTESKVIYIAPKASSGVSDIEFASTIHLFPNPATDNVRVQFTAQNSGDATLEVVDMNGRLIEMLALDNVVVGTNTVQLNVSDYANGIYSIVLRSNNSFNTTKLVISK